MTTQPRRLLPRRLRIASNLFEYLQPVIDRAGLWTGSITVRIHDGSIAHVDWSRRADREAALRPAASGEGEAPCQRVERGPYQRPRRSFLALPSLSADEFERRLHRRLQRLFRFVDTRFGAFSYEIKQGRIVALFVTSHVRPGEFDVLACFSRSEGPQSGASPPRAST